MSSVIEKDGDSLGDTKLQSPTLENEIPAELKETQPVETVSMLDKRFEELLAEIKILTESRGKDFQKIEARVDRMPALPNINYFEKFKTLRKEKLDRASEIEIPAYKETASQAVVQEMNDAWNVDAILNGPNLLYTLKKFFRMKSMELLDVNSLLVSRWNRFCRSAADISKFLPSFQKYQEFLRGEYIDAVTRYEKISEQIEQRIKQRHMEQAAREAERIANERAGNVTMKNQEKAANTKLMNVAKEALKIKKISEKHQRDQAEREAKDMLEREKLALDDMDTSDDMINPGFDPEDITVYLRDVIGKCKGARDLNVYLSRAKLLTQSDRSSLLRDYKMLYSLKPGKNLPDIMNEYEGLNMFMEKPPQKVSKVEDFLTEFEILCAHFAVDTPISLEDGRPFVYEVDGRFASKFSEYLSETTHPPYESGESDINPATGGLGNAPSGGSGERGSGSHTGNTAAIESISLAISAAVGLLSSNAYKPLNVTRLKAADWIDAINFRPHFEEWQDAQKDILRSRRELDFEVLCDFDLLGSTDIDFVLSRLKESAKKNWDNAVKRSNTKPLQSKGPSVSKQSLRRSNHSLGPEEEEDRLPASFDLGMLVPDGREHLCDRHVLDGKKQHYGQILRTNEENRLIEQELMNVDPSRSSGSGSILEPTLATIFAEHEVLAYFELRFMRTRELRLILSRQLNFMRSVEKRINVDWKFGKARGFHNFLDPISQGGVSQTVASLLSSMLSHTKNFNTPESANSGSNATDSKSGAAAGSATGPASTSKKNESQEDIRYIKKSKIYITDLKGISLIYDVTLEDMKALDKELLKLATIFINNGLNGREAISLGYMDELRFKMADRKAEIKDITFLNPAIDRSQLLLELYDAEVKFQYAKIDAINAFLEIYEHCSDQESRGEVCQIITNLMHLRPHFNFESPYFTRDYSLATKSLEMQSKLVSEIIKETVAAHRDWVMKTNMKLNRGTFLKEDLLSKKLESFKIDTPLPYGLPWSGGTASSDQSIVMHYEGVALSISEFVPWLSEIPRVWKEASKQSLEFNRILEMLLGTFSGGDKPSRAAVDCIIWKHLTSLWQQLSEYSFNPPLRGRRSVGGLDSEVWLENPLLPDLLLSEKYVPYELPTEGNSKSLGNTVAPFTMFTDPPFKPKARHFLARLLKLIMLRNKLFFSWIEADFWKFTYEDQFPQMGLNKTSYSGRLGELRYDVPEMVDTTVVEDEEVEEFDTSTAHIELNAAEITETPHNSHDTFTWRVGPLAIAELDESQSQFDFSKISNILQLLRPNQLRKLSRAVKIQLLEKNWLMGAVEVHSLILFDIHRAALFEKEDDRPKSSDVKKTRAKSCGVQREGLLNQTFDVDYRTLVTSILPKKKQMRKAMLLEYAKEHKSITKKEISEAEKETELSFLRNELIEWYFRSISEIVVEECERAELAKLMIETRRYALSRPIGKILFRQSRVTKNAEYFASDKGRVEQGKKGDTEKIIQIQDVVFTEIGGGTDHLLKLWYLPHVTEVLIGLGGNERIMKNVTDISAKLFRNSGVYSRSLVMQSMILDILSYVCTFAHLLCDNNRYVQSVRELREADYIVNVMSQIKKDLYYQGSTAEYSRVENYLKAKWRLWFLRIKLILQSASYTLKMRTHPEASNFLASQLQYFCPKPMYNDSKDFEISTEMNFSKVEMARISLKRSKMISQYIFSSLDPEAKRCAETKILELDDCLEQYLQATMLNFGENTEEVNRTQMEYLTTCLKLYKLRQEYFRIILHDVPVTREEQVKEAMKTYKVKILVGAIKLYHKLGSRGGASTAFLLRDEVVTSSIDMEFSRLSQAAFDRCQISMLQNELLRLYTLYLIKGAKAYYDRLADERSGRLFKLYETIEIQSQNGDRNFAFRLSDDDYASKSSILHGFVDDLYKACSLYYKDKKASMAPLVHSANGTKNNKDLLTFVANNALEENRIFACTKENLSQAILKLGIQISKWHEVRIGEQEHFSMSTTNKLIEALRAAERTIHLLLKDRKELLENFAKDVRLASAHSISDIYAELATLSVEVNELRKTRRVEERKLRNRIIDEYDEMVSELVIENHVIRNRFNEYRTNTVHEVMGIISETKKEELQQLARTPEIPDALRKAAEKSIKHEEITSVMKNDIHELNMTLLKVRSMFTLKEQSLRSSFEKKMRKLSEDSRIAEEKLWDSYREAESRERALRRTITKTTKSLIAAEASVESLQRQLKEEQSKARVAKQERSLSARIRLEASSNEAKSAELAEKLKKYDGINVDRLLGELTEKTKLIEQFVEKDRERERQKDGGAGNTADEPYKGFPRRTSVSPFRSSIFRPRSSDFRGSVMLDRANIQKPAEERRDESYEDLKRKFEELKKENEVLKQQISRPHSQASERVHVQSIISRCSSVSSEEDDEEDEESTPLVELTDRVEGSVLQTASSRRLSSRNSRRSRNSISDKHRTSIQKDMNVLLVEDVASQASYKSIESLDGYRGSLSGPSRHLEPLAPPSSWAPSAASTPRSGTPPSSGETKYKTATVVVADLSMAKEKSKAGKKIDPSPSPSAWTVSSPPPQNEAKAEKPQSRGSRASLSIESGPKSAGANFYLRRKTLPSRPFASAAPHRRKSSFAPEIPSSLGYTDVAIGSSSARLKRDDEDFKARSSSDSIHKSGSSKVKNKK